MTVQLTKKIEFLNLLSSYDVYINGEKEKIVYKKELSLQSGSCTLFVKKGLFESNKLILNNENYNQEYYISINGTPYGRHGQIISIFCVISLILIVINNLFIDSNFLYYLLLIPFFIYLLLPIYSSIFEKRKNRIELILKTKIK